MIAEILKTAPENYKSYIQRVGNNDVMKFLTDQLDSLDDFFDDIPKKKHDFAYAPGKWTIKEILGHLMDTERIYAYRILRFVRGDQTELPGFDENVFVKNGGFQYFAMEELLDEFHLIRQSNLALFKSFTPKDMEKKGIANGVEISVGQLLYVTAGHAEHHLEVIRERYLK